ncbi:MAG TPA: CTP synthase [Candidatus Pacearchaeota archaeon]|nr:CTP synthase [Candidatus Pacearchaeota archaeon]HPZ74519.1 CTP synthase [Candidatus Pacearchaeota archaeon]HQD89116.1 CTP synthase [Candidatus Pacearchaeota archaeon]
MTKYIFVCGGVMSGIGKGVSTASIGKILESRGFKVSAIKIDPYINVDAGTMNPIEHGEVFVTEDGVECDQDIGNYERFLEKNLFDKNYITTGRVYQTVIQKERNLEYNGRCVEVVPDIPNEVIRRIKKVAKDTKSDFVLIEIGGTVGEYQNLLFLEAARMMKLTQPKSVLFVLVSYLPVPKIIGEMKTKPTQYAVRSLNSSGIQPDIIVARSEFPVDEKRKEKLSVFCNVKKQDIISAPDAESIYEIPLMFEKENIVGRILSKFEMRPRKRDLAEWQKLVNTIKHPKRTVRIGIAGKYFRSGKFTLMDSYISVIEAIKHASFFFKAKPEITWLDTEEYEKNSRALKELENFDGIIVPGGFGSRGIEGKIKVIKYCRENKIPFLGLCLGMQLAVVEFSRNVCGLKGAHSVEIDPKTKYPVIDLMEEQKKKLKEKKYGGTMRLGAFDCKIAPKTISFNAYKSNLIRERHRHRFEVNDAFKNDLERNGMIIAGINPELNLVEIIELPEEKHPFFVGTQFHPEFKSRPLQPHPLFKEFIRKSLAD